MIAPVKLIPPWEGAVEGSWRAAVHTPKDFELNRIMTDVVRIVEEREQKIGHDASRR